MDMPSLQLGDAAVRATTADHVTTTRARRCSSRLRAKSAASALVWVAAAALVTPGRAASQDIACPAPPAPQNTVTIWDAAVATAASTGRAPASAEYLHAIVHLAVWDAVVSIHGGHEPYLGYVPVDEPASLDAAIAAAAYGVASARMSPEQAAALKPLYDATLAGVTDPVARANGDAVGTEAAARLVEALANDGFDRSIPYVQPTPGPGVFEPVAATPVVDEKLKQVVPLLPRAIDAHRPRGPLPLDSVSYATEFEEVKRYGRREAPAPQEGEPPPPPPRTNAQHQTARFWSDHTFRQYARALRDLAIARGLDTFETSRLLAKVHLAAGDAVLAGFEAKYHFMFWRPVHAIQRADTDGNARTEADPSWTPLLVGNHPEYPSGHSFFTSAVTHAVQRFFGANEIPMTISSDVTQTCRTYGSLREIRNEVGDARVWGGLHFRSAMEDGDRIGQDVAREASRYLRPLEDR